MGDVNRNAAHVVAAHLDLPRMKSAADLDPESASASTDRLGTAHPPSGTVEGREHAVSSGLDLTATESPQLLADHCVVAIEQVVPASIAALNCLFSRPDNVGEEDRGQNSVGLRVGSRVR